MENELIQNKYKLMFKKKAKFIKKSNLFGLKELSLNEIYEFLSFINGFKDYKEFIKSIKDIDDSRLDFLNYQYKIDMDKRISLCFKWFIKNYPETSKYIKKEYKIFIVNSISHSVMTDFFYKSLLILEGNSKINSMFRKFDFKNLTNVVKGHPVIISMTEFNDDFILKIIKMKKESKTKIFNITDKNYDFNDTNYFYSKQHNISSLVDYISSKVMINLEKSSYEQYERENIFIIINEKFSDKFEHLSLILEQARSYFNFYIINSVENMDNKNTNSYNQRIMNNTQKIIIISSDEKYYLNNVLSENENHVLKKEIPKLKKGMVLTNIRKSYCLPISSVYEKI